MNTRATAHVRHGVDTSAEIREAAEQDLSAVASIYDAAVLSTYASFDLEPQGVPTWRARLLSGDPLLVAVELGEVVGFAYASAFRPRPGYRATMESSVYVRPDGHGRGVGRLLYDALLAQLDERDVHRTTAVIALPNDPSITLHERTGFRHVGTLSEVGHKFGRWIDVAIYERPGP